MKKNSKKKEPILVVKPCVVNALFPIFVKNLFVYFVVFFSLYVLISLLGFFFEFFSYEVSFNFVLVLVLIFSFFSILFRLIILRFTTYYFYDVSAIKEFSLIIVKRRSVVYSRITNISLKMGVWDRITRAGKITLHTGDDEMPALVLRYVKNPRRVESFVYSLIHKKNQRVTHDVVY